MEPWDARAAQGAFQEENATFGFRSERLLLGCLGNIPDPELPVQVLEFA